MSDPQATTAFGQPPSETKRNMKVFGLRVKIEPYTKVRVGAKPARTGEAFDRFAVVFDSPQPEE
jgi:hypothetical protein